MIIRRHKCESCGKLYDCNECSKLAERMLVLDTNKTGKRMLLSPECKKKFECDDCKRLLDTDCFTGE